MRESRKHWRRKHPNIHRSYGEKRDRTDKREQKIQEEELDI